MVLNVAEDSARFSHAFDIFHELAQEVSRASERDVKSLREAGFEVETLARRDEWERESTFRKADLPIGVAFVDARLLADGAGTPVAGPVAQPARGSRLPKCERSDQRTLGSDPSTIFTGLWVKYSRVSAFMAAGRRSRSRLSLRGLCLASA